MLNELHSFFSVKEDEAELNRARYYALARQLPLMYGIVTISMFAASLTHFSEAPWQVTVLAPALLFLFTVARTIKYIGSRHKSLTDVQIARSLRISILIAAPMSFLFSAWGLTIYQYGSEVHHAQTILFFGVTMIACAFCLLHVRQASITILVTATACACSFLLTLGDEVHVAISFNFAVVSTVFGVLILRSERDFSSLILQKREQRQQHLQLQALNEENKRLANTDSLTGLANRRQFLAEIDQQVQRYEATGEGEFVIALLDLDGFKPINDVFGHPVGDQVLCDTANRLLDTFEGQSVRVARLGGDEFGLLFCKPGNDDEIMCVAESICEALRKPFRFEEGTANLSATIGMARFPASASTRSQLFDRADYALYYAKQNSKSEPVFFSHEHERLIFANSALEQALHHADIEKEMSVEFQPVLDLYRGHTSGLEALARWYSPTLGNVRPDLFIKAAENIGLIGRLTEVLFRKAISEARHWPASLTLSFNLSATSLNSTGPILRLLSIAEQAGFSTNRLMFEITESAVMKDFESAKEVLDLIRSRGAHVAIDDFGTGFSSLAYVHRLPLDTLKIDRSFVLDLFRNEKSPNVLRSILNLCENLAIRCVIEGVETQEQFDLISDLGGQFVQGYYYSKPLSAGDAHLVLQIEFGNDSPAMLQRAAS